MPLALQLAIQMQCHSWSAHWLPLKVQLGQVKPEYGKTGEEMMDNNDEG